MKKIGILNKIFSVFMALSLVAMPVVAAVYNNNQAIAETVESSIEDAALYEIEVIGSMDYDQAFQLIGLINQHRSDKSLTTLKVGEEAAEFAMQRAVEAVLRYNKDEDGTMRRPNGGPVENGTTREIRYQGASAQEAFEKALESNAAIVEWAGYNSISVGVFKKSDNTYSYAVRFSEKVIDTEYSMTGVYPDSYPVKALGSVIKNYVVTPGEITMKVGEKTQFPIVTFNGATLGGVVYETDETEAIRFADEIEAVKEGTADLKVGFANTDGGMGYKVVKVTVSKDAAPESDEKPNEGPDRPGDNEIPEFGKLEQAELSFDMGTTVFIGEPMALKVKGGSGDGEVLYSVMADSGNAKIEGGMLIPEKVGMISVIATKSGSGNYKDAVAMTTMFIEAKTTTDNGVNNQIFQNETPTTIQDVVKQAATLVENIVANSLKSDEEIAETDNAGVNDNDGAGEYSEGVHREETENDVTMTEETTTESTNSDWMVWLWFLIPIITLLVMIILFAKSRLR